VLKHGLFPLSDVLSLLLEMCAKSTNSPVEIEFAVRLARDRGQAAEFAFLQLRPLAEARQSVELDLEVIDPASLACRSSLVLGNGGSTGCATCSSSTSTASSARRAGPWPASRAAQRRARARAPALHLDRRRAVGVERPAPGIPVTWDQISALA